MDNFKENNNSLYAMLGIPTFHSEMTKCFITPHHVRLTSETYVLPNIQLGDDNPDDALSMRRRYLKILGCAIYKPDIAVILENAAAIVIQQGIESSKARKYIRELRKSSKIPAHELLTNYADGIATKIIADLFFWDDTIALAGAFDHRFRLRGVFYKLLKSIVTDKIDGSGFNTKEDWEAHAKTFRLLVCPTLHVEYYQCPSPGHA